MYIYMYIYIYTIRRMKLEILEVPWKEGTMKRFLDTADSPAWVGDTFIKDT